MAGTDRRGFRTVKDDETEEFRQKLREHRHKVWRRTALVILIICLACGGFALYMAYRHYDDYDSISLTDRTDTDATQYAEFQSNILKYSNDGATYTDAYNELIWNQTYEMANPQISICEGYLAIYDRQGMSLYIMSEEGQQGYIETTMPIDEVSIASQGTVAVLMRKESSGYLALYDKQGENLAEGELHGDNGGYPIAIALSHDALKLAVSLLDVHEGSVKSTVAFYNYGSVGQNEIDRCVGMTSFDDTVIPEMTYTSGDYLVAYSDDSLLIFEGNQKPQLQSEITLDKEIKSIFYNDTYFGIVTDSDSEEVGRHMMLYNKKGNLVMEQDFDGEYEKIMLLRDNEVCVLNRNVCDLYTTRGVYKFHYEFDEDVYAVLPGMLGLNYTIVRDSVTESIRIK
jgi:hypothetical protein